MLGSLSILLFKPPHIKTGKGKQILLSRLLRMASIRLPRMQVGPYEVLKYLILCIMGKINYLYIHIVLV